MDTSSSSPLLVSSVTAPDAGTPQIYLLDPTDQIQFTYSVLPVVSYLSQNGFHG